MTAGLGLICILAMLWVRLSAMRVNAPNAPWGSRVEHDTADILENIILGMAWLMVRRLSKLLT